MCVGVHGPDGSRRTLSARSHASWQQQRAAQMRRMARCQHAEHMHACMPQALRQQADCCNGSSVCCSYIPPAGSVCVLSVISQCKFTARMQACLGTDG